MAQAGAAVGVAQHFGAQFGIGGVHRNIQRRNLHADDAVGILVAQIGHGDIVAQQEGQTGIVVLKIQALAHALGQLIDEAEDAPVGTALLGIHQIGLELQTQILAFCLADLHRALCAVLALNLQRQLGVIGVKLVIQHIPDGSAADGQQGFPHLQAGLFRRGTGIDFGNDGRHKKPPFHKFL